MDNEVEKKPKKSRKKIISIICGLVLSIGVIIGGYILFTKLNVEPPVEIPKPSLSLSSDKKTLRWRYEEGAINYVLYINDEVTSYETTKNYYIVNDMYPGQYDVYVEAVYNDVSKNIHTNTINFAHAYEGLKVVIYENSIDKVYDGTLAIDSLKRGIHYEFENAIYGDNIELEFTRMKFVVPNAVVSNEAEVSINGLVGEDRYKYSLPFYTFTLNSTIKQREIKVDVDLISKDYYSLDPDTITIYCEETGEDVEIGYTRTSGEEVGTYDIKSIFSNNTNYILNTDDFDGKDKFIIEKILIKPESSVFLVSKEYDGTDSFDSNLLIKDYNYLFNNEIDGLPININITDAHFESVDVIDCECLIVNFTPGIYDSSVYKFDELSFKIPATITPFPIFVYPDFIPIRTPADEDLNFTIYNEQFSLALNGKWIKNSGVYSSVYSIVGATSENNNFCFIFNLEDGINKILYEGMIPIKNDIKITQITNSQSTLIVFGEPVGYSLLNQPNSFGYFRWVDPYQILPAGIHSLPIEFVFNDLNNYDYEGVELIREIDITIQKKDVEEDNLFPLSVGIQNGMNLGSISLNSPYGLFDWLDSNIVPSVSGTSYDLSFTPYDTDNYLWSGTLIYIEIEVIIKYSVHFDVYGGLSIIDGTTSKIEEFPLTYKTNYALDGWYLDSSYTERVTFPYEVISDITLYALWRDKSLIFTLNEDETGYIVSKDKTTAINNIVIPSMYNGLPVVALGIASFSKDTSLVSITIPFTVSTIYKQAFYKCLSLKTITINSNESSITFGLNWDTTLTDTEIIFAESIS
jgi:hypothetical protein